MGLDLPECWFSNSTFNWFGHQSRLLVPPAGEAPWWKGHLDSDDISLFVFGLQPAHPQLPTVNVLIEPRWHRLLKYLFPSVIIGVAYGNAPIALRGRRGADGEFFPRR